MEREPRTAAAPRLSGTSADNDSAGTCRGNSTAPGPKTAFTCAAITTYWRRRIQRGVDTMWGPGQGGAYIGPPEIWRKRGKRRRQRRQRPGSACSKRATGRRTAARIRAPPNWLCALNVCSHPGGGGRGGNPSPAARANSTQPEAERDPSTQQHVTLASGHKRETVGGTPTQQRAQTVRWQGGEGDPSERPRATPARSQEEEEEVDPPEP